MKASLYSTPSAAILAALAAVLGVLVWQGGQWYQRHLVAQERARIEKIAASHLAGLSSALNQRIGLIRGLAAVVTAKTDTQSAMDDSAKLFLGPFENFAASLQTSTPGIRRISIAPDNVVRFVYPVGGNGDKFGVNLLGNHRPGFAELARRAIETRNTIIHVRAITDDHPQDIAVYTPVFAGSTLWGGVEMMADLKSVLEETRILPETNDFKIALYDERNRSILGTRLLASTQPVIAAVVVANSRWNLEAAPTEGWAASVRPNLLVYFGAAGSSALLIFFLAALALNYRAVLQRRVVAQTTALRESEASARQARQRLEMAIEAIPEGFAYYDADDRLVMFNRNYRRIYEDCSDLIVPGAHFPTILQLSVNRGQYGIPPDQREKWTKDRIEQHRNPPGPIEHQLSNGRWVRIEEKRTPDGGYVGFRTDITDFKRREIELQRQTTLLNATLQNMSEGISVIDKDLRLVAWNDKFLSIMRLPPHLVFYGAALRSIILFQATRGEFGSVDPEEEADRRINAREQMKKLVVERQRADGTTIELRRSPMPDGGIVTVYSDITERKRTESALMAARDAAEQATGIKSEFLATMSHEIRTPMNGVVGMTELLLETELGPIQRRYAEIIQKSAYSLLNIINAVLDFSKLEAGRFDLERAPFNLADSVTVVADLIAPQTRAKGISFESKIAPDVPLQLIGDAGRLRQLLLNLLNNAVKFTDSGSVRLEVIRLGRSEGKVRLHFTVSDTGIGIAPTMQSRLFNRFEQLDPSINRRFGGTGLGLAICKKLTELMGGEIGVESEIGQGSKFWFAVDLSERAATESAPQLVRRDAMLPERALHVLLVEDNAVNQLVAAAAIESLGHSIEIVATGGAAVDAVRARAFDLVFMDLQMPEMDGFQATRQIRDLPGERGQVPIIALTAYTRPDDRERCLAAGMNGYLVKPLQKSVLESILLEWSWRRDTKVDPAPVERLLSARRSSSPATSRSVIDRTVLTAIESDVGESAMAGLIAKFVADAHKHLTDLRAAAENSDSSAIQRHAHILAGTFRTFGLVGAAPIADEIENACRQKDTAQASSLAAALAAAAAPALSEIASLYTPADGKTATA